jgi:hypothetical protein
MAILELLFLRKFSTTLLKVDPPCKISKLDFLNGQTQAFHGQVLVNSTLEGILVILVNMNIAPLVTLSVIKVL